MTKFSCQVEISIIGVVLFALVMINNLSPSVVAQRTFVAGLTGNQVIPSVNTTSTGSLAVKDITSGTLNYVLNVTNLSNITRAEINIGAGNQNGPEVLTIFIANPPTAQINGTLAQGNITSANLQGPLKSKPISSLIDLMERGNAYVLIKTLTNPNGSIRGQIGFEGIDETGTSAGEQNLTNAKLEVD